MNWVAMPEPTSPVPEWARAEHVRYARWDGGPLEVAKGILSGWPYLLEPDQIYATTNWYSDASLPLLAEADINWIWVTWSVGFSPEDEAWQQEILSKYVRSCHDVGVRVTAYISIANLFHDSWLVRPEASDWLQRDAQNQPIPYGAAKYSGATTRFLACLSHPGWLAHLAAQIEGALDAGVDGIMFDNAGSGCQCVRCGAAFRTFAMERSGRQFGELPDFGHAAFGLIDLVQRVLGTKPVGVKPDEQAVWLWRTFMIELLDRTLGELAAVARRLRPNVLVYVNHNVDMGTLAFASSNAVSSEDAREPGVHADGSVIQNGGLLRLLTASAEGRRPVRVEFSAGHGGKQADQIGFSRFRPMSSRAQQRSIAEAAMHGASAEVMPEGYLLGGLVRGDGWARDIWTAIGRYHLFLAEHPTLFAGTESTAEIAVVVGDRWPDDRPLRLGLLEHLSRAGLDFDIVYDRQLRAGVLERYELVLLADVTRLSDDAIEVLRSAVASGVRVLTPPGSGRIGERFETQPPLRDRVPGIEMTSSVDRPSEILSQIEGVTTPFLLASSSPIVTRLTRAPTSGNFFAHLLNLGDREVDTITIVDPGSGLPIVHTPDANRPEVTATHGAIRIRNLDLYAILEFADIDARA